MGRKLAGLAGIIVAVLAFGLTATGTAGHAPASSPAHHALAEGKGPTSTGS
ncbi:hypothetical protein [Actinacidiphila rubida]|uniref:Uncharacterized protein n=1 Tax=Actinacidiphila rubida TaxID=310780 RepID=A0A1H8EHM8_9ACTN|nr:hypothetical protein [Actinacidiphila rubida]SEN19081.1 hypothetical protein SAMN05216267_1002218 [Actinacidiphila rubida]